MRQSSGAGGFACQPSARPLPIAGSPHKAGSHRIVLDIADNPVQFVVITNPMIERFLLPKHLSSSAQNLVGLSGSRALQPAGNYGQRNHRLHQHVNMIRHDDPGRQGVKAAIALAAPEGVPYQLCNARVFQPKWPGYTSICVPIKSQESSSRFFRLDLPRFSTWKRTGQTPSHKQEDSWCWGGLPMRQLSTIEHELLAGETACPTKKVALILKTLTKYRTSEWIPLRLRS